jgi:hypothetical protein
MKPRELDLEFFEATLIAPVRQLTEADRPDIAVADYLHACDEKHHLLEAHQEFIALRLFLSGDQAHVHAVFWYGHSDRCLVLVLNRVTETILGHHFLNLPDTPDEHPCPVPNPPNHPTHLIASEAEELPEE